MAIENDIINDHLVRNNEILDTNNDYHNYDGENENQKQE